MEYMTDGDKTFVLNQEQMELFFKVNARTLKRWRDGNKITFKEIVSGTYFYIIDASDDEVNEK